MIIFQCFSKLAFIFTKIMLFIAKYQIKCYILFCISFLCLIYLDFLSMFSCFVLLLNVKSQILFHRNYFLEKLCDCNVLNFAVYIDRRTAFCDTSSSIFNSKRFEKIFCIKEKVRSIIQYNFSFSCF